MSLWELLATVLAFSAPVAVVSGFIPFVIVFDGAGAPAVFLCAMALLLIFAIGFTTMTRYLPRPGGFYAYVTAGLGRVAGLGAAMLAIMGYLLLGFCTLPFFAVNVDALVRGSLGGPAIPWPVYGSLCGLGSATLCYFRIDLSAKVLTVAMALETLVVVIFDIAVLHNGGPEGISLAPLGWSSMTSGSVGIAILFAVTCFLGFEATAIFREEVRDAERTVPRATYLAVLLIGLFYAFSAWMTVSAFGMSRITAIASAAPANLFPRGMELYVGRIASDALHILLATSQFAAVLSAQNILARYGMSLGIDGVFPRILGHIHSRHQSPHVASMAVSLIWLIIGALFVLMSVPPDLLYARVAGVGGFAILLLMLLTSAAIIMFFRRSDQQFNAGLGATLFAPALATLGLGAVVYLAIANFTLLIGGSQNEANALIITTFLVFFAGAAYACILRSKKPTIYRNIGRQLL
ncbi:amino acid permease [Sphingobium cupriresistens LL01]|uniref:Amino acid permease n=2 Tax=Sphingobium cupriresistens TaxID=1132417 RepID=A0A0J7Y062_9SPHN|nr:amino acid permease [Sphingobium cupriresistens LL01]